MRQQIVNHTDEDEMYVQIKDKLQEKNPERKYEGYKLEEDELLTYKNIIYIPNVAYLRRVVMDEIHQLCISVTQGTKRQLLQLESSTSGQV